MISDNDKNDLLRKQESLLDDIIAYPAHSAVRFSFDGKSESWLMASLKDIAVEYKERGNRLVELKSVLRSIEKECIDVREGMLKRSVSLELASNSFGVIHDYAHRALLEIWINEHK